MAGLDLTTPQESIKGYLGTTFPNHAIVEDALYDDEYLIRVNGVIVPYITLRWGAIRPRPAGRSVAGPRWDDYYATVDVGVVAATGKDARTHLNVVRDRLVGFKPLGAEKLHPSAFGNELSFTIFAKAKPTAYLQSERLEFNLNGEGVATFIQPD